MMGFGAVEGRLTSAKARRCWSECEARQFTLLMMRGVGGEVCSRRLLAAPSELRKRLVGSLPILKSGN